MVEIVLTPHFRRSAKRLHLSLHAAVEERVAIFQRDPFDAQLKTHKLTGRLKGFWSFSVDHRLRVIFEFIGKKRVVFHVIGDHSIYDVF